MIDANLVEMYADRKRAALEAIDAALQDRKLRCETLAQIGGLLYQISGVAAYFGKEEPGEAAASAENQLLIAAKATAAEILNTISILLQN